MTMLLAMMVTILVTTGASRVTMSQSQACYYQPHNRELVCQCQDDSSYLHLRLIEFVVRARQEVGILF